MSYYNNHAAEIDTLAAVTQLEGSDLTKESAEAIVNLLNQTLVSVTGKLASKADLQATEATLKGDIGDLKGQIGGLEGRIGSLEGKLEGQIGGLKVDIAGLEGKLEGQIKEFETSMYKFLTFFGIGVIGVVVALLAYMSSVLPSV